MSTLLPGRSGNRLPIVSRRKSRLHLLLEKEWDDRGPWRIVAGLLFGMGVIGLLGWSLGGLQTPSFSYLAEAYRVWKLEHLGGEQVVSRAIDIYDEIEVFEQPGYNALDISATTLYVTATSFEANLRRIVERPKGRVRIALVDPTMAILPEKRQAFERLAAEFGQTAEELLAEAWLSTTVLARLKRNLGAGFEVRFYRAPQPGAYGGHLLVGRSYQKYDRDDPGEHFDIVIPYDEPEDRGKDGPVRKAWRIKDAPENLRVRRYRSLFEEQWERSVPIEQAIESLRFSISPPDGQSPTATP